MNCDPKLEINYRWYKESSDRYVLTCRSNPNHRFNVRGVTVEDQAQFSSLLSGCPLCKPSAA